MKKIFFLLVVASLGFTLNSQAQKKLGYVMSQELLSLMPEAKEATATLEAYQAELEGQLKAMTEDGQKKYQEFQDNQTTWSDAVKETKMRDLQQLDQQIAEFQGTAMSKMEAKRNEVFQPLMEKAIKAIEAVGKEGNYDYIFDGGGLLYAKEGENLMPQVKTKLGIK